MKENRQRHLAMVTEEVEEMLPDWANCNYTIELNDDSDKDETAYLVSVRGSQNNGLEVSAVVKADDDGNVWLLQGEEFYETSSDDLLYYFFVNLINP